MKVYEIFAEYFWGQNCIVGVLLTWPYSHSVICPCYRYGNLVNDSLALVDVSCDAFLSSQITYKHNALRSPKTDYLQVRVVLTDNPQNAEGSQSMKQQWFAIRVNIEQGADNQPPEFR